ncbi:mitochondrial substrate carrier family protein [Actinidia rufa]|uniref:Mitochondrial substrate carrier family protein n=1 Tax=Actinidia rufa TaxID=165716 RepID=A0A7J0EPR3_9ERIC|nr:mitochondrial substrate carrier family protein [Actinidia rufa]
MIPTPEYNAVNPPGYQRQRFGLESLNRLNSEVMKGREGKERAHTKVLLTSLSAMAAETTTFPIDMTKTRLQLHGESLSSARPTSAFGVAADILRREGPLGLYKGLTPAIIRHLFYTPIRIVGYEHLRNTFVPNDRSLSLSSKALIGGISGVIAQVVASPAADLVKVRMQADGRMVSQGLQPRAFLVNMGELACYDHAKRFVIQNQLAADNIYAHTAASIMSGLSATALSCPADVVKDEDDESDSE